MKKTICLIGFLLSSFPLFGQATTGYHRVNQVIARSNSGTYALVVPFAQISVTDTATGMAAVIYFDPLLSSPIPSSLVTADLSGNYSYYMPLNTCNTEVISAPGQSSIVIPNICGNPASTVLLQTNGTNNAVQSQLNLVAGEGVVLENSGATVTINAEGGSGVSSINTVPGAFTFSGAGVSCASTTCTFSGTSAGVSSIAATLPLVSSASTGAINLSLTGCFTAVGFSSTPIFNLAQPYCTRTLSLTGNVSSSTATNVVAGLVYEFIFTQDATGGRTFVWPTNIKTTTDINRASNGKTTCFFTALADLNLYPNGACTWN